MRTISKRVESVIQKFALIFSIGFFFFMFSTGLAQYHGIIVDFSKIFADTTGVANPGRIEFSPAGSADLQAMENGDYFEAVAYDVTGVILKNVTLDVQYSFTPAAGGPTQRSEVASWGVQDENGRSLHQITSSLAPGIYQLTGVRDSRLSAWQTLGGPSVIVVSTSDDEGTGELRGKTSIDNKYVRDPQGGPCSDEYVLSGVVISYTGPVNGSIVQATCSTVSGHPIFSVPNLPAGDYYVSITVPDGYETVGEGSVNVSIRKDQQTVQFFNIRKVEAPPEGAAMGELRGKTSFGDKYIRDSSGPECQSEYLLDGVAISYSGPESGTLVQNQCSLVSGHPIFSKKLPVGKYQVSISAPKDWVIEGSGSVNIDIKKDRETVQFFSINKKGVTPAKTAINLDLEAVKPAKLKELKAGDQYSVKATYSDGTPLNNKILDVAYLGPDTAGEEKIVEQWAKLDDNGFALMNITKDMPAGEYNIHKVRVHASGDENSEQGFIMPTNKPSLKIAKTKLDVSQFITTYTKVEYNQLSNEERVVYKILNRFLLGDDTEDAISISNPNLAHKPTQDIVLGAKSKLRYLGKGRIITDNPAHYLAALQGVSEDWVKGVGGFAAGTADFAKFIDELNKGDEKATPEKIETLRLLLNFKILELNNGEWSAGSEGSRGFLIAKVETLAHEEQHLLDQLNEESQQAVTKAFNSLPPADQISYFLALIKFGYNVAFDSFDTITEWHAYTTTNLDNPITKEFLLWYNIAKKDFDASLMKFIKIDSGAKASFVEEVFKTIKIHYDKNTKEFLITILGEDGTVAKELKIDWETFKQIPSIIRKYYEKLLITNCKPSPSCSKAARDEILELLKVPVSSFTGTKVYENGKLGFYRNGNLVGPQGQAPVGNVIASLGILPKQTDRVQITVTVRFPGALYSDTDYQLFNKAIIVVKRGDIVIAATTIPDIFKGSGLNLPSNPEVVAIDLTRIVKADTNIFYAKDVNGDEYYINVDPKYNTLSPTGFAQIRRADGTMTIVLPGGGIITGKITSSDGKTVILDEIEGWTPDQPEGWAGTLYFFDNGAGGYGSCTVERDCQLYDKTGKQTWHIDRDGYVTNPNNGWNGNNPFDASRAQIFLGNTGNALGQVSGWVKDNQGTYHNGGYIWPNGDVGPNGMGYNMPEIKRWRLSPGGGPGDETNNIIIRAKGTFAGGAYPIMELRDGEKALSSWTVGETFQDYTYSTSKLEHNLRVAFINDYYKPPKDRNLEVDYISVNGKIYQSESGTVYSTGTYTLLDRCKPGFKTSQFLQCFGYFEYPTFQSIKP